jgi:UDP-N-acetylglucosamine 2-epimerase
MNVIQVVGARPNFMKVAPLHRAIKNLAGWTSKIVHTGQHFDAKMSDIFFTQLELPKTCMNVWQRMPEPLNLQSLSRSMIQRILIVSRMVSLHEREIFRGQR